MIKLFSLYNHFITTKNTSLSPRLSLHKVSLRFMMCHTRNALRSGTQLTRPILPPYRIPIRGPSKVNYHENYTPPLLINPQQTYATYSVNHADPNSPNLKAAAKNNPPTPHPQVHRERCDELGCNGKICIGLCSIFKDRKAIAHGTHGNPPKELGKTVVPISNTDFNGKPKNQKMSFYDDAHDVNPTSEHIQGTQQINNDPNIMQKIKQHEDKK